MMNDISHTSASLARLLAPVKRDGSAPPPTSGTDEFAHEIEQPNFDRKGQAVQLVQDLTERFRYLKGLDDTEQDDDKRPDFVKVRLENGNILQATVRGDFDGFSYATVESDPQGRMVSMEEVTRTDTKPPQAHAQVISWEGKRLVESISVVAPDRATGLPVLSARQASPKEVQADAQEMLAKFLAQWKQYPSATVISQPQPPPPPPPRATHMSDVARRGVAAIADTGADHMGAAGEAFLATIARYGSNDERRVAAFGNRTAAKLSNPTCAFLARYMALEVLANGVSGPIGAVLASLGKNAAAAMAEYSKDDALTTAKGAMQSLHLADTDAAVGPDSLLTYRLTALELQPQDASTLAEFGKRLAAAVPSQAEGRALRQTVLHTIASRTETPQPLRRLASVAANIAAAKKSDGEALQTQEEAFRGLATGP